MRKGQRPSGHYRNIRVGRGRIYIKTVTVNPHIRKEKKIHIKRKKKELLGTSISDSVKIENAIKDAVKIIKTYKLITNQEEELELENMLRDYLLNILVPQYKLYRSIEYLLEEAKDQNFLRKLRQFNTTL